MNTPFLHFKTSETKEPHILLYARQLHAYAYALENAARGQFSCRPVSKLGLLVFEPDLFVATQNAAASLNGKLTWIEIQRDERTFLEFISSVLFILEQPSPPLSQGTCEWCGYRNSSTESNRSEADLRKLLQQSIDFTTPK